MSRTRIVWFFTIILSIGIALRSYHVAIRSIWFDESFTWRLAQFPLGELMNRTAADVHPPLYYVLIKGWAMVFGPSILALRSFSVFCAAIVMLGVYWFTAEAFRSKRAGLYASALIAVSPWAMSYAWEARMYTLGMALAIFSSLALLRAVRRQSFIWFVVYGILAAAFAYVHYYALFTIIAQIAALTAILVWQTKGRIGEMMNSRLFWGSVCGLAVAALLFSPWFPTFMKQRSQVQEVYWVPRITLVSVPDTLYRLFVPTINLPAREGMMAVVLAFPLCGAIILWLMLAVWRKNETRDGAYSTLALGIIPFILGIIISLGPRSLYNDRFFAFAGIFVFIAIAGLIDRIIYARVRNVMILGSLVFLSWAHIRSWKELDIAHAPGVRGAIEYVMDHRDTNDMILTSSPYIYFPLAHYVQEEFHAESSIHLYVATKQVSHFSGAPIIIPSDIATSSDVAVYTGTVWVVDTTGFTEKPLSPPPHWQEISREIFPEVFVHQGDVIVRKFAVDHL